MLTQVTVSGLFDEFTHVVHLRETGRVTILAGPNGVGKTTLLALISGALGGDIVAVAQRPFRELRLDFDGGATLVVIRTTKESTIQTTWEYRRRQRHRTETAVFDMQSTTDTELPPWISEVGPGIWRDLRYDRLLDADEVAHLLGRYPPKGRPSVDPPPWLTELVGQWPSIFIETRRLDSALTRSADATAIRRRPSSRGRPPSPIGYYLEIIESRVQASQRESFTVTQRSDQTFARRLLAAARANVSEQQLRRRYAQSRDLAGALAQKGLLRESIDDIPEGRLSPTTKRILALFLDDFEKRMSPLEPVANLLAQLERTINAKFIGKQLVYGGDGHLTVRTTAGLALEPNLLSSGEQHELALAARLLFDTTRGAIVLVDEPELSLHVGWQHDLLKDLREIGDLVDLTFVLATHSTAVINGHWDLVEELLPQGAQSRYWTQ